MTASAATLLVETDEIATAMLGCFGDFAVWPRLFEQRELWASYRFLSACCESGRKRSECSGIIGKRIAQPHPVGDADEDDCEPEQRALQNGERSSAIPSSQPHFSTG
ncbi:hypothetical protein [Mesorhizobium sp. CN2-181]|uniref:hypothetical protein n=1 Tax=Mesorhizobium yinganensis TaxID=3157707 RepID=UPI0032B7D135